MHFGLLSSGSFHLFSLFFFCMDFWVFWSLYVVFFWHLWVWNPCFISGFVSDTLIFGALVSCFLVWFFWWLGFDFWFFFFLFSSSWVVWLIPIGLAVEVSLDLISEGGSIEMPKQGPCCHCGITCESLLVGGKLPFFFLNICTLGGIMLFQLASFSVQFDFRVIWLLSYHVAGSVWSMDFIWYIETELDCTVGFLKLGFCCFQFFWANLLIWWHGFPSCYFSVNIFAPYILNGLMIALFIFCLSIMKTFY